MDENNKQGENKLSISKLQITIIAIMTSICLTIGFFYLSPLGYQ